MGQPYTESANDVFNPLVNPGDWLEMIDSGASPSETHLSNDAQEGNLVGYIPWNKQRSAVPWWIGFPEVDSDYTLHRQLPQAHPTFPFIFADSVSFKPFNPTINPANPSAPLQFVSPFFGNQLVNINIANHKLCVCNVKFRGFRCLFLDDTQITDPRMEWMRYAYLDMEPNIQALSASGIGQLKWAETVAGPNGPTIGQTFPAPIAELLGKNLFTLTWLSVPYEYLNLGGGGFTNGWFNPSNILACLGLVNSTNFPFGAVHQFVPGTLLMHGVKFVPKPIPVAAADPANPLYAIDVTLIIEFFAPEKGVPGSSFEGHNLMPWRGEIAGDDTAGKFFYATRSGNSADPPLLASTDFNNMFKSPNA